MKFINHFWSTFWNLQRTVWKAKKIFLNKLIGFVIYPFEFAYDSSTNWSMKKNLHLKVPGRNPHNFWISCLFVDSSKSEHGSWRICSTNKGSRWTSSRTIEAILKFTSLNSKVERWCSYKKLEVWRMWFGFIRIRAQAKKVWCLPSIE